MASTYSDRLRLELIGSGEQSGTWGTTTNVNIGTLIEEAIAGHATVSMSDANYTLTTNSGVTDEARQMIIKLTGTLSASRNVICPTKEKLYVVDNATSGGQSIVFKTSSGSGVTITNGQKVLVFCDGTNVVVAQTTLGGNIVIPDGGTIGTATDADSITIASAGAVTFSQRDVHSAGITVADGGQIGSASDADAVTIASGGAVTFSQRDVHSAGITVADGGQIGSASAADAITIASGGAVTMTQALTVASGTYNPGLYIGDTAYKLFVTGGKLTVQNSSNGVELGSGATSWASASDERNKDIIENIDDAVEKVGKLRAVIGKYKDEENKRRSFLIAQDVQSVLPEAVDASDSDNLTLRYTDVIPLLVASIKELKARIEVLENE